VFFERQDVASLKEGIRQFEAHAETFRAVNCRESVLRFNPERFRAEFKGLDEKLWREFQGQERGRPYELLAPARSASIFK
jgi:hypothetical protein